MLQYGQLPSLFPLSSGLTWPKARWHGWCSTAQTPQLSARQCYIILLVELGEDCKTQLPGSHSISFYCTPCKNKEHDHPPQPPKNHLPTTFCFKYLQSKPTDSCSLAARFHTNQPFQNFLWCRTRLPTVSSFQQANLTKTTVLAILKINVNDAPRFLAVKHLFL